MPPPCAAAAGAAASCAGSGCWTSRWGGCCCCCCGCVCSGCREAAGKEATRGYQSQILWHRVPGVFNCSSAAMWLLHSCKGPQIAQPLLRTPPTPLSYPLSAVVLAATGPAELSQMLPFACIDRVLHRLYIIQSIEARAGWGAATCWRLATAGLWTARHTQREPAWWRVPPDHLQVSGSLCLQVRCARAPAHTLNPRVPAPAKPRPRAPGAPNLRSLTSAATASAKALPTVETQLSASPSCCCLPAKGAPRTPACRCIHTQKGGHNAVQASSRAMRGWGKRNKAQGNAAHLCRACARAANSCWRFTASSECVWGLEEEAGEGVEGRTGGESLQEEEEGTW
jgi:hypothetical protein